ncbi:cation diffusion facilitator family transporter [Capillimicrobium parvum]|uniref:Ferrous-iron efflux pump FieF n=1 Tax=Capillimicrobium parvum TaxID=2884022 RepID=A0A9E6Y0H1_9ACTN|nr:cation diffusion facilitator family transporter [Capillimicrobium parvum]UGS37690.1 Ferrous-iron efflux pump FieF [Capillimicrobium parvum]
MAGTLTPETAVGPVKRRAAALSIASNSLLIVLKFAAGIVTGSVALLAEAMQSIIDLVASVVAYVSVRKADEPADENHPYGHEKIENLAAAIEGVLILVGSAVIAFEAARRLINGGDVERLGFGIVIIALTIVVNLVVSGVLARRARETGSPALEGDAAHLRTDALTSVGVLVGLLLVQITGASWLDPVVALLVAAAILATGVRIVMRSTRVLVDEGLPPEELEVIRAAVVSFGPRGIVGFHKLRARRAGARRLVDMHVQFRAGATLEEAHATAHELQDEIRDRLGDTDVLIHIEPADRVRPGTEIVD